VTNLLLSPTVKRLKIGQHFIKVMSEYRLARFYGPQCSSGRQV